MLKIRFSRSGSRNKPFYRIVVIEEHRKRGGESIDIVGYFNPLKKEKRINKDKIKNWISKGAIVSKSVSKII